MGAWQIFSLIAGSMGGAAVVTLIISAFYRIDTEMSLSVRAFMSWFLGLTVVIAFLFNTVANDVVKTEAERKRVVSEFLAAMQQQKCKRTSYAVPYKSAPIPVWTCPDGTANLQPS